MVDLGLTGQRLLNPSIDLGRRCNLNCSYCFTRESIGRRRTRSGELTESEIFVLDDLVDAGARTVNIVGGGEPLLHPSLRLVVERLHNSGVTVVLFTNGTRLATDPDLVSFLFDHGVTVVLKYNSRQSVLQDAVAGRRGYTAKRDQALRLLIDTGFNRARSTRLGVDTLVFSGNLHELPDIHRWCRRENIYPLTSEFIPAGRTEFTDDQEIEGTRRTDPGLAQTCCPRVATDYHRRKNRSNQYTSFYRCGTGYGARW